MKIIIITTRNPMPPFGGEKERIISLLSCLPEGSEILVYYLSAQNRADYTIQLDNGDVIKFIAVKHSIKNILFDNYLINWFKYPVQSIIYQNKLLRKKIIEHDLHDNVIVFHLFRSWQFVELNHAKVWVELTDLISRNYSSIRRVDYLRYPRNLIFRLDLKRIKTIEKLLCTSGNLITLISQYEANYFKRKNSIDNIRHLPIIYTKELSQTTKDKCNMVCVVGNFHSIQNQIILKESLSYFSIVKRHLPNLSLKVVGKIPTILKFKLLEERDIISIEEPEDLLEQISECKFGLCPMVQGAGVQNKILDYLAAGIIPLATQKAVSEFELVDRKHYIDLEGEDWAPEFVKCCSNDGLFSNYVSDYPQIISKYSVCEGKKNVGNLTKDLMLD